MRIEGVGTDGRKQSIVVEAESREAAIREAKIKRAIETVTSVELV